MTAWRAFVFTGGLALLLGLETWRPAREWRTPRWIRLLFHGALAAFNTLVLRFIASGPLLMLTVQVRDRGFGLSPLLHLSGAADIAFCLVLLDLLDYWWHRFNHTVPFFWRFHKVHHVDTHVDVSTSLRFHTGELLLSVLMKALWVLAVGPSVLAFAVFETGITLAAQFHHSNIDFPDGLENALRNLIVTPRFHASHHTVAQRTREANFSTIFIFWDRLFGSYREPDAREMAELGLPQGRQSYLSPVPTLLGPFTNDY